MSGAAQGIRTDAVHVTTVHGEHGQWANVGFVWLAANSPVTVPSKADLSGRRTLLLYADVIGEGMTRPTELLALKAHPRSPYVPSKPVRRGSYSGHGGYGRSRYRDRSRTAAARPASYYNGNTSRGRKCVVTGIGAGTSGLRWVSRSPCDRPERGEVEDCIAP
jgi:hypothetical protein